MKLVTDLKLTVWKRLRCKLSSRSRPTVLRNGTSRACMFLHLYNNCEYGITTTKMIEISVINKIIIIIILIIFIKFMSIRAT